MKSPKSGKPIPSGKPTSRTSGKPKMGKPNPKKRQSTVSLPIVIGGVIVLITGGIVAYWTLGRRPGFLSPPVGADIVPREALTVVSFSSDPEQWQELRQFGTPETQAQFDRMLVQWRDRLLSANGYDYAQDIQPWAGDEVTLAFLSAPEATELDPSDDPQLAPRLGEQSMMWVVPIEKPEEAKRRFENPKSLPEGKWSSRTYQNHQVQESEGKTPLSATVLDGRFLVITNNPKTTDFVIDAYEEGNSINTTPGYQDAQRRVWLDKPFAKVFVNVQALTLSAAASSNRTLKAEDLSKLQQTQGLAATATLQDNGILLRGTTWLRADSDRRHSARNGGGDLLSRYPSDTFLLLSGGNLRDLWQDYTTGAEGSPVAPISPKNLRQGTQTLLNLDLDKDLLSWMGGEFALGVMPLPSQTRSPLGAGLVAMVNVSDRGAAEAAFQKLDTLVKDRYQFQVQTEGDPASTRWTSPEGGVHMSHGWLSNSVAFWAVGEAVTPLFMPAPKTPLTDSELFKTGVPNEPRPNNGHFFVDLDRLRTVGQRLPAPQILLQDKSFVPAIRSLGVTAAVDNDRRTRYDIFVQLVKGTQLPASLPSPQSSPGNTPPGNTGN